MAHVLPDLPYPYDALEPFISRQIMELHHKKHHQTYVNALNAAEAAYAKAGTPKERIALQAALKFNGGGKLDVPSIQLQYFSHENLIGQAILITLSSGRTLHLLQARARVMVANWRMALLRMQLTRLSVALII